MARCGPELKSRSIWPALLLPDGKTLPMIPEGPPVVKELNRSELSISQTLRGGESISIVCSENRITFTGLDERRKPLPWVWEMVGGAQQKSAVQTVFTNRITYNRAGMSYELRVSPDAGSCQQLDNGTIRLIPNRSGKLVLILGGL